VIYLNFEVEQRSILFAKYIIENNTTVRDTAKHFGISKSTVHKDVTERLFKFNLYLYEQAREVLNKNKAERHIRGGMATKRKYESDNKYI
jgi:putative DeoR family transcriptional regulator (stage III sporulation protein D)